MNNFGEQADRLGRIRNNLQAQADRLDPHVTDLQRQADGLGAHVNNLQGQADRLDPHVTDLQGQADRLGVHVNNLQGLLDQRIAEAAILSQKIARMEEDSVFIKGELSEQSSLFQQRDPGAGKTAGPGKTRGRQDTLDKKTARSLDAFYLRFENQFRGSPNEIKKRVQFYLPYLTTADAGKADRPVLDLGCGRGEWLELLKEHKLKAHGVDMNAAMIAQCRQRKVDVVLADAIEHMRSLRANSHGADRLSHHRTSAVRDLDGFLSRSAADPQAGRRRDFRVAQLQEPGRRRRQIQYRSYPSQSGLSRDRRAAVADVSFSIAEGEIIGVFGPNGSGKTTLLSLIAGMLAPTSGTIVWKGRAIQGRKPHDIAAAGVVKTFQNPQVFAELSVFEHLMISGHLMLKRRLGWRRIATLFNPDSGHAGADLERRATEVLRLCRLEAARDQTAAGLSYGEEKMLGVAMALMCEPELLLLDEPASGLGQAEIENLEAVLRDLRRTAPRCASSTTRSVSSASSPTAPSACTTAPRSPRAPPPRC